MMKYCLLAITPLVMSAELFAASEHGAHHQAAHVHGLAELTLVQEGNVLELALESPAANIVGFENAASTAEQRRAVAGAKAALEAPQTLFVFVGTPCELQSANVDVSSLMNGDDANHHAHQEHHHNTSHAHDSDRHSEVTAHYRFTCKQGAKLTTVSVALFDPFPGIESLNVSWITDVRQGGTKLTKNTKDIRLR